MACQTSTSPVERDFVLGREFDDPKVHRKYTQPTKHQPRPSSAARPSGFPVIDSIA